MSEQRKVKRPTKGLSDAQSSPAKNDGLAVPPASGESGDFVTALAPAEQGDIQNVPAPKSRIKKIAGICLTVLLWTVLACSAFLAVFSTVARAKSGGKDTTWLFGLGFYEIVSGSMEPEIHVGDVLVGKRADVDSVKEGDVILFRYGDIIIAHKLLSVNGDGTVTTHGIANPEGANETVPVGDILARKVLRLPGLGYVVNFIRSPYGFLLLIVLPVGAFIIFETVSLTRRLKEYRAAKESDDSERMRCEIEELKSRLAASPDSTQEKGEKGAEGGSAGTDGEASSRETFTPEQTATKAESPSQPAKTDDDSQSDEKPT